MQVEVSTCEPRLSKENPSGNHEELTKINLFMRKLVKKINQKQPYRLDVLAKESGIDIEAAERFAIALQKTIGEVS